jgi:hypothetical protein
MCCSAGGKRGSSGLRDGVRVAVLWMTMVVEDEDDAPVDRERSVWEDGAVCMVQVVRAVVVKDEMDREGADGGDSGAESERSLTGDVLPLQPLPAASLQGMGHEERNRPFSTLSLEQQHRQEQTR